MATPSQNRDRYRRIAHRYRSLPGQYGLRPHTVEIRLASWSGSHTGDGTESGSWTTIAERDGQPPKVRQLSSKELTLGDLGEGTIEIGPITPRCSAGGTDLSTLLGRGATKGQTFHVRITGPNHPSGAVYELTNTTLDKALHYTIQAKPVANS